MDMLQAMEKHGGSFVKALAVCFRHADYRNEIKLLDAFPGYIKSYTEMAELITEQEEGKRNGH